MALENSILDRYRVQIDLFDGFLSGHLKYFNNLDFFTPYVAHINAMEALLAECREYLEDLDDEDDVDYDELEEELKNNYAERLKELLDMDVPDLSPKAMPKKFEVVFNDINTYITQRYEEVCEEGLKLYRSLLGAA